MSGGAGGRVRQLWCHCIRTGGCVRGKSVVLGERGEGVVGVRGEGVLGAGGGGRVDPQWCSWQRAPLRGQESYRQATPLPLLAGRALCLSSSVRVGVGGRGRRWRLVVA